MAQFPLTEIKFESTFFEDEVREGFYITSMMKRYWACQLKVLSVIAAICERHGLRWFAEYGTMMGAVRHGGYIPWDDDLDICMLREDFEKFFDIAEKETPQGYQFLTISRMPGYEEITGRVVNSNSIDYSNEHLEEYFGCPYTVGVDIFPLDGVYNDEAKEKERNARAKAVLEECKHAAGKRKHELLCEVERIYSECPTDGAENLAFMPFFISKGDHLFPSGIYENIIKMPFENTSIDVAARYEELLELEYGDYLNVNKHGGLHDYPVFVGQENILKEKIGRNPYRYTINYNELLKSVQRYAMKLTMSLSGGNANGGECKQMADSSDKAGSGRAENNRAEYGKREAKSESAMSDIAENHLAVDESGLEDKKIVAFLPCKAKWWKTMEPLWRAYVSNPTYEVHVLPIFYYDSDFNGNVLDKHDERDLFPEYLHVEPCEKFDFETIHPDTIVFQVPYDGYSTTMTVHEYFYSANLQSYTDELVYVPCMDMEAPLEEGDKASAAISVFVEQEGVVNADRIVLNDPLLRDFYIKKLVELTGNDTAGYWKQKIVLLDEVCRELGGLISDENVSNISENRDFEWDDFLGEYRDRKVIIYHITISFLLRDRTKSLEKIERSVKVFEESGDKVCAVILPQKQILTDLPGIDEDLWNRFNQLVQKIKNTKNCIYDHEGISLEFMHRWNGYYGDADPIVRKCVLKKIPVMIENIDV